MIRQLAESIHKSSYEVRQEENLKKGKQLMNSFSHAARNLPRGYHGYRQRKAERSRELRSQVQAMVQAASHGLPSVAMASSCELARHFPSCIATR